MSSAARGGTLVATVRSEPRTFNRLLARDRTSFLVGLLTQATLVRINHATQELEPWLAERWTASADGRTWTLSLRRDVRFSDGTPFTARDVLFSFDALYDDRVGSPFVDAVRVNGERLTLASPDPHTVTVTFPGPFGPGLRVLANVPMLPHHRLAPALADGSLRKAWPVTTAPSEMAGLGPFVLERYTPGERLVFARNPHYWRRDDRGTPLPYLDRLTLEIVPDQNAELLRLQAGQSDLMSSELRPDDVASARRAAEQGSLKLIDLGVGLDADFLWFNLRADALAERPWVGRAEFRQAIAHAVDRAALVNTVYRGAAVPVSGPVTPGNRRWHVDDLPAYALDRDRARTLLASIGLVDRNGDGLLDDAAGRPVRFSLLTQKGSALRERAVAVIQQDLRAVGVGVDLVTLEVPALIDRVMRGTYEAAYFGAQATDTDPAANTDFWVSSGTFHLWHPQQASPATAWEREIDELMRRQTAERDPGRRFRLFAEVQQVFARELPAIYFVVPRMTIATSTRVRNVQPGLLQPLVLWNADSIAVSP